MRKPKIYEMRKDGWNDYWEIYVFATCKDMQRYLREHWIECESDTRALVHPVRGGGLIYAECYLNEEYLGSGLLSHEMVHVAMAHERKNGFGMNYGPEIGNDEERLAYFQGDCMDGCVNTLRDNGHIKKEKY